MRISNIKTIIQKPVKILRNKFSCYDFTENRLNTTTYTQKANKYFNKIKNLYYSLKENIYLLKYKLKEFAYCDNLPKGTVSKIDKPTKTQLSQRIKPYLRSVFDNNVDPAKLDRKLTSLAVNVKEEEFGVKGNITMGRKKVYTMTSGKELILETHNYKDPITNTESVVTRIYDRTVKQNRDYVDLSGNFVHGSKGYKNRNAHLQSGKKGLDWIMAK